MCRRGWIGRFDRFVNNLTQVVNDDLLITCVRLNYLKINLTQIINKSKRRPLSITAVPTHRDGCYTEGSSKNVQATLVA
jgi:hypothetical protein